MTAPKLLIAAGFATMLAGAVQAQGFNPPPSSGQGFNEAPAPAQGFSFQGDTIPSSPDPQHYKQYDDRYSQTYKQQQAEPQKPGGGCLSYGALGAAGGHLAG